MCRGKVGRYIKYIPSNHTGIAFEDEVTVTLVDLSSAAKTWRWWDSQLREKVHMGH